MSLIDTSNIDPTVPPQGNALTADVRSNFGEIKQQFENSIADHNGPANKTAAKLLTPEDGIKIYPQGSDGGVFIGGTGKVAGYYDDDGDDAYGIRFKPTGGDGSAGWERAYKGPISFKWYKPIGDGIANDTTAWTNFLTALEDNSARGWMDAGTYLVDPFTFGSPTAGMRIDCATFGRGAGSGPGYFGVEQTTLKCRTVTTSFITCALAYDLHIDGLSLDGNKKATNVLYFEGVANNVNIQWRNAEHYGAVDTTGKIHFYDGTLGGESCNFYNIFLNSNHNRDPDSTNRILNCLHNSNTNAFLGTYEKCWFSGADTLIRYGAGSHNLRDCQYFHATSYIIYIDATTQAFEVNNGYTENSDNVPFLTQGGISGVDLARPIYLRNNTANGLNQGMNLNCQQPVVIEGGSYSGDINITPMATYGIFVNTISDVGFPIGKGLTGTGVATHADYWNISINEVYIENQVQNVRIENTLNAQGMIRVESAHFLSDVGATPDVLGHSSVLIGNTAPQNITNFVSTGISTHLLIVTFNDANTTLVHSALLRLTGSGNVNPTTNSVMMFLKNGASSWLEMSRSIK